ncbi:helix-turn-helix transcriptional regulator [Micromonospora sp. HUAS LYJ1]|uniref:helix-turn-helix domain-containing protein n=1 Tax=Micromonospora sp. HUAS LYJ1 TaxID=3061626 RepID=UPI002673FB17|nr:helix-turn-helix transcriptional regulator [Micromonospora sp. HUAS LYJ1]WKU03385.1 helix-turn-helix transcriptional regulator [Micromonospora sp. HUAS LYJ1]
MAAGIDPAVQRRRLRAELRRLRTLKRLTQKEVAERVGWSPSKLIRIETGQVGLSATDLKALLGEYDVSDPETINSLVKMAKEGRRQQWGPYRDVLNPDFLTYLGFEGSAAVIRQAEPQVLPGLLQTREYARAVIEGVGGGDLPAQTVDRQVEVRMKRQEIFDRPNSPEMFFIIDESALRRPAGGADAMRRQLRRLKKISALDHVHIRAVLLDSGTHPGLRGSFVHLEFPDAEDDDMLLLESSQTSLVTKDDTEAISRYRKDFTYLEAIAASEDETGRLIDRIDADLERLSPP